MRLILASASPRRAELLRAAGFTFDVVVADVDEAIRVGELPATYVRRLAAEKSYVVSAFRRTFDSPAEAGHYTTVGVDDEILGKPRDDADAAAMLRKLSGRRHQVLTGVSLRQGAYEMGRVETTDVYFRTLSNEDVAWYVASGDGRDKAGAYAIQGLASRFVSRIDGSYANVVGLPIATVAELLPEIAHR